MYVPDSPIIGNYGCSDEDRIAASFYRLEKLMYLLYTKADN